MKICKVAFENLNSLAGAWEIDFEDPAYADGLFLICGVTGAGKTTILDAISLALYGCTVRESVTGKRNEVMTRGTGFASAAVTFETERGRFTATWQQQRAHLRQNGALQSYKRTLHDETTGQDTAGNSREVEPIIREAVGMDFEQFQRTVMLAQGKFDTFLNAKRDERAAILEKATGTEVYAKTGAAIHTIAQQKRKAAEEARLRIETLQGRLMPEADRQAKQTELEDLRRQTEAIAKELTLKQNRLKAYEDAERRVKTAQATLAVRTDTKDAAQAKRDKTLQTVTRIRAGVQALQARREREEPLLEEAVGLKNTLVREQDALKAIRQHKDETEARIKTKQAEIKRLERAIDKAQSEAAANQAALEGKSAPDQSDAAKRFLALGKNLVKGEAKVADAEKHLEEAQAAYEREDAAHQEHLPLLKRKVDLTQKAVDLARAVASLEERRAALVHGESCPLCGSTHHPYVEGTDKPELDVHAQALERAKQELDQAEARHTRALQDRDKTLAALQRAQKAIAKDKAEYDDLRGALQAAIASASTSVREKTVQRDAANKEVEQLEAALAAHAAAHEAARARCDVCLQSVADKLREAGEPEDKDPEAILKDLRTRCQRAERELLPKAAQQEAATLTDLRNAEAELQKAQTERQAAQEAFARIRHEQAPDPDALQAEIDRATARRDECLGAIGQIQQRFADDEAATRTYGKAIEHFQKAQDIAARWDTLDGWLGGDQGKFFRRYAQGITLRSLLQAANRHLEPMSRGRYRLFWGATLEAGDEDDKLLPFIEDRDQGNEIRPVTNLSGGERFQVSLALALGLSEMSGTRLRVDTLFLDEGFGTLDAATLNIALDTLCRIRQNGKTIGIISHVTAVGERIKTQISVQKCGAGRSELSGPGVRVGDAHRRTRKSRT